REKARTFLPTAMMHSLPWREKDLPPRHRRLKVFVLRNGSRKRREPPWGRVARGRLLDLSSGKKGTGEAVSRQRTAPGRICGGGGGLPPNPTRQTGNWGKLLAFCVRAGLHVRY